MVSQTVVFRIAWSMSSDSAWRQVPNQYEIVPAREEYP